MTNNSSLPQLTSLLQDLDIAAQVCLNFKEEKISNEEIKLKIENIDESFKYYASQTAIAKCDNLVLTEWIAEFRKEISPKLLVGITREIDINRLIDLDSKFKQVKTKDGGYSYITSPDNISAEELLEYQTYSTKLELLEAKEWQPVYELLQSICDYYVFQDS